MSSDALGDVHRHGSGRASSPPGRTADAPRTVRSILSLGAGLGAAALLAALPLVVDDYVLERRSSSPYWRSRSPASARTS